MSNLILSYINLDAFGNLTDTFNPSTFISRTIATQSVNTESINITGKTVSNSIDDYGTIDAEHLIIQESANYLGDISANSTCICTTQYLETRFQELLGPETIDNLNSIKELSTAMNNDPQFFITVNNNLNDLSANFTQADTQINIKISDLSNNLHIVDNSLNLLINDLIDLSSYSHNKDIQLQDLINDLSANVLDISQDIMNYKSYINSVFVDISSNISNIEANITDLSNNTSSELTSLLNTVNGNISTSVSDVMTYIDSQDAIIQTNIDTVTTNLNTATTNINNLDISLSAVISTVIPAVIIDVSGYKAYNNTRVNDLSNNLNMVINDVSSNLRPLVSDISNNFYSYVTSNNTFQTDISLALKNNVDALTLIDNSYNFLIYDISNNLNALSLASSAGDVSNKLTQLDSSLNSIISSLNSSSSLINDLSNNKASITYVNDSISALIDSSPSTLDTLNELATALGNDANFSTTITNSIGLRALDSDVLHLAGTETITGNKTFSGTVSGITKSTVGLSNVDNTSDLLKPISTATQTALDGKQATLTSSSISDNLLASTFVKVNDDVTLYINKTLTMNGNILADGKTISPIELSYLDNLTQPLPTTLTSLQNQIDSKQATLNNGSVSDAMLASSFVKSGTAPTLTGTNITGIPSASILSGDISLGIINCSRVNNTGLSVNNGLSERFTAITSGTNAFTLDYSTGNVFYLSTGTTLNANFSVSLRNLGTVTSQSQTITLFYPTTGKYFCNSVTCFTDNGSTGITLSNTTTPLYGGGVPTIATSTLICQTFSILRTFGSNYCITNIASYF